MRNVYTLQPMFNTFVSFFHMLMEEFGEKHVKMLITCSRERCQMWRGLLKRKKNILLARKWFETISVVLSRQLHGTTKIIKNNTLSVHIIIFLYYSWYYISINIYIISINQSEYGYAKAFCSTFYFGYPWYQINCYLYIERGIFLMHKKLLDVLHTLCNDVI